VNDNIAVKNNDSGLSKDTVFISVFNTFPITPYETREVDLHIGAFIAMNDP